MRSVEECVRVRLIETCFVYKLCVYVRVCVPCKTTLSEKQMKLYSHLNRRAQQR